MPKITRSDEEIDQVREQIVDCALGILESEGYEKLSMHRVGSRMNMTAANLYNYYGNKNELLIAIHKKTYGMLHDLIDKETSAVQEPFDKIEKLVHAYVLFGTTNVNIYDIMFNRPILQHSDYIGTALEDLSSSEYQNSLKALQLAASIVGEFMNTGPESLGGDPILVTIKLMSQLHGIISLHNSRVLPEIVDDSDAMLGIVIGDILESLKRGAV